MRLLQIIQKHRTILSIFIALGLLMLVSVPATAVMAAPTVTIDSPGANTYYLVGTSVYIEAYVSGTPTSVTAQYLCRTAYNNNTPYALSLGSLTEEGSSNYYSMTFTVTSACWPSLANYAPNLSVITPQIQVTAIDGTGTTKVSTNVTFCCGNQSTYSNIDSTFNTSYYNQYVNPFWGCYTGPTGLSGEPQASWTYNCMAYALGLTSGGWLWPWSGNPTYAQVSSTMSTNYGYTHCSQTTFSGAQVFYYSGGHFSKVTVWDVNGLPSQIESKWGGSELLSSLNANPFTSGPYGSAIGYFSK